MDVPQNVDPHIRFTWIFKYSLVRHVQSKIGKKNSAKLMLAKF